MGEADRLRLSRLAVHVGCPWCGEAPGLPCRGVDGKVQPVCHEQRQAAWYAAGRPGLPSR